jgi:hypothetical protein
MLSPAKSVETWQALLELRCRREIIERWLASPSLSGALQQSLGAMLHEVEDQLQSLTNALSQ